MAEYIEKLRITVGISRAGEPDIEGCFSLSPLSEYHSGAETLLEFLNERHRVLPFQRQDGVTMLLARHDVQWVFAGPGVPVDLVRPRSFRFTREERVRVRLCGGEELEGLLQMELPDPVNRASDYLNGPEDFFPLTARDGVYLIQKHHARETILFEASPVPVARSASTNRSTAA
ncbi:MAG: hypothetical protein HYR74_12380 [Candidatus Eisenbacteria bacterium]|nr:hypothetical protein [Candidatus Eisenbacteria bacterium]